MQEKPYIEKVFFMKKYTALGMLRIHGFYAKYKKYYLPFNNI